MPTWILVTLGALIGVAVVAAALFLIAALVEARQPPAGKRWPYKKRV